MKWQLSLVALAVGAAVGAPVLAQTTYSDAEAAYFAAKWQEADFAREDGVCPEKKYRTKLTEGRSAFEQSHPGYVAALALPSPRPELVEVTNRKLDSYAKAYATLLPMLARMPHDQICGDFVAGRASIDFDKRVANARDILARDVPPAPEAALTSLGEGELDAIVGAVMQHKDVAMYLHPEVAGRVPVRIALAPPYADATLKLSLYDKPVKAAASGDRNAMQLVVKPHGETAVVEVKYDPEGIFGSVELERVDGVWRVSKATIYE
jgi:hypothetical protein